MPRQGVDTRRGVAGRKERLLATLFKNPCARKAQGGAQVAEGMSITLSVSHPSKAKAAHRDKGEEVVSAPHHRDILPVGPRALA